MADIAKIIALIPSMDAKARAGLRKNAETVLRKKPDDKNALNILDIPGSEPERQQFMVTGLLSWEPYRPSASKFRAFHEGSEVGAIFKNANHNSAEKDVYSVEMNGQHLQGRIHRIEDARAAGEAAFVARRGTPEK